MDAVMRSPDLNLVGDGEIKDVFTPGLLGDLDKVVPLTTNQEPDPVMQVLGDMEIIFLDAGVEARGGIPSTDGLPCHVPLIVVQLPVIAGILWDNLGCHVCLWKERSG